MNFKQQLQEAYEAGYYRALNEQSSGGLREVTHPIPNLTTQGTVPYIPTPQPVSKYSTANRQPGKPLPSFNAKAYFQDTYGEWMGDWLMGILGAEFDNWEQIMNDGSFVWPAPNWTPNGSGGYNWNGEVPIGWNVSVVFVDGTWTFNITVI